MIGQDIDECHEPARKAPSRNEQLVLGVLKDSDAPLGAYQILSKLEGEGIKSPLQVYRALRRLQATGEVHRLESLNAFVLCRQSCSQTHRPSDVVFVICDRCGAVEELRDDALFDAMRRTTDARKFSLDTSMIEVRGICCNCI